MANVSVAEAASRLGVNVARIHQRIADGSLHAERIGSHWVVDELSLLQIAERRAAGRPLSSRSAWALIALSAGDEEAVRALAPAERSRARHRLDELLGRAAHRPSSEDEVRAIASSLRALLRNRADRRLFRAAPADLHDLSDDVRWQAVLGSGVSGIASRDVEGYVAEADAESLVDDYLLVPSAEEANVVMHVVPPSQRAYPDSNLQLAADLAEHRSPREEARAAELLHGLAQEREATDR